MAELFAYSLLLVTISIFDIRSMIKKNLKKEIVPYLVILVAAAVVGLLSIKHPYQKGIVSYLLDLFKVQR